MFLQDYHSLMYKKTTDPKQQLWQAVHNGDYNKFEELINANTLTDINEYKYGITLLHALVLSDGATDEWGDAKAFKIAIKNKIKIAQRLLTLGANLHSPAQDGAPFAIHKDETPWQMAASFDELPFYHKHSAGMRASLFYTGEHVLPVFKKHLGIEEPPSMLTQCYDSYKSRRTPLLILGVTAVAAVSFYKLKSKY